MKCRDCQRETAYTSSGLCPQCTPRPIPKWGIYQERPIGAWLQWNGAVQIMETTSERRHAATWTNEQLAEQAAAYYELMFGPLKVERL